MITFTITAPNRPVVDTDISPDFRPNKKDASILRKILPHEATPEAIKLFDRYAWRLSDYAYWFTLGTLWVSYTGWSDLDRWVELFSSTRPNRDTSLMKPSELKALRAFPPTIDLFRAHRPGESRWISYTLDPNKAGFFAQKRGVDSVSHYRVKREDAFALFLRRGEFEVLVLDQSAATICQTIPVVVREASA